MFLRTIAAGVVVAASITGSVNATANPETNHTDYWGDHCTKTEMSGQDSTFTAPAGTTRVVVKGGTGYKVYSSAPFTNLTAPVNPKTGQPYGISHVIVCTDEDDSTPVVAPTKPEQAKPVDSPKGGADATPIATTPEATSEVLPEAGAGAATVVTATLASMFAAVVAYRRYLTRYA